MTATTSNVPDLPRYADRLAEELEDLAEPSVHDATRDPDRFLDREESWLDFNARVLELAEDQAQPLLERARFCAIFADNLDEFFMVRVAGLQRRLDTGLGETTPAGLSPRDQLDLVARRAHELMARHAAAFRTDLMPALQAAGVEIRLYSDLDRAQRDEVGRFFEERVFPVLTPLAVDPAHPFPYISGLSLNLAVLVRDEDTGREHFARVKVPPLLPRLVPLGQNHFVRLEDVISAHLPTLFPGLAVAESTVFRVTRNEDLTVEEDESENLLKALERELTRRRFGPAVRLEVAADVSDRVLDLLARELDVTPSELYRIEGPIDLSFLWQVAGVDLPALAYPTAKRVVNPRLRSEDGKGNPDIFAAMRDGDILLHHPYDSFSTSVQALLEQAAADPSVLAIKQTLYRTSGDSPLVDALIDAAEAGKQVLVVVEIKARFDEQANIRWARALEHAGCHVVYGLVGLKTHCKLALVVRQEPDGSLRRYVHIGTGNYNPKTARIYEDLGLLTANARVGDDVADLFNHLSGYTRQRDYDQLLVAPDSLRPGLLELVAREIGYARAGRPSGITIKVNSLVDEAVIDALYDASAAGVPVDLVVRGMCAVRPGVPGLSDRIRVRSLIGRFLEHSRVFWFRNADDPQVWIGSADIMHRNLDRRVEALVQVTDPSLRAALRDLLDLATDPTVSAWTLGPDGRWTRQALTSDGSPCRDYQDTLLARTAARAEDGTRPESTG